MPKPSITEKAERKFAAEERASARKSEASSKRGKHTPSLDHPMRHMPIRKGNWK